MYKLKSNAVWTYLATVVICICCYVGTFHTHHYFKFDLINWLHITIGICIVIIQMTSFEHRNRWISKLRALIMVSLIGGPIVYSIHVLQERYCKQQLEDYGIVASGKVIKLYTVSHGHSRSNYYSRTYAELEYRVDGKIWKQKVDAKDYDLSINDQIEIKCSSEEPEIVEILEVKKFRPY